MKPPEETQRCDIQMPPGFFQNFSHDGLGPSLVRLASATRPRMVVNVIAAHDDRAIDLNDAPDGRNQFVGNVRTTRVTGFPDRQVSLYSPPQQG
jgi:hypothetical protein